MAGRFSIYGCSVSVMALAFTAIPGNAAWSQPVRSDKDSDTVIAEIVVTAQKREQSLQDVPVAVTALTEDVLKANRIQNIQDLSGMAPGVTIRPAPGGASIPSLTMRGVTAYGAVPGADREVSFYVDGVYLHSPYGSLFDLPDIARIEVLRGPQGTLFGRNSTAGAISVYTRDPTGDPGVRAEASTGNRGYKRFRLTADLPRMGPLSAYVSFVHNYQRGAIRNTGAGTVWDRTASPEGEVSRSPSYLGTRDSNNYFAAVKFAPSDDFTTVYKFDNYTSANTPEASVLVGYNENAPLLGPLLKALYESQPTPVLFAADGDRPNAVNNAFSTPTKASVHGHNLTSTYRLSDSITVKNTFGYRKSHVLASASLDGASSLIFTDAALVPYATFAAFSQNPGLASAPPEVQGATIGAYAAGLAPLVGSPIVLVGSTTQSRSQQYSDELQVNYDSDLMSLTAGGMYLHTRDTAGSLQGMSSQSAFTIYPGYVIPLGQQGISHNRLTALAAYVQGEIHLTPQLDLVLGGRVTNDRKSGNFEYGPLGAEQAIGFRYRKTKPTYSVGVNYKLNGDTLLYAKRSTGFVSGGSVSGIGFAPETVAAWEAGVKTELFNRRLRLNLALFDTIYKNVQAMVSATTYPAGSFPNQEVIGIFIQSQAEKTKARGFELETTAALAPGLTAGGSLSYTEITNHNVNPSLLLANGGPRFRPTLSPKWTAGLYAQYESPALWGDASLFARLDANWRSRMALDANPDRDVASFASVGTVGPVWMLNGRLALRNVDLGGVKTELGLWGRNLTDNRKPNFGLTINNTLQTANYPDARSYGVDLIISF